MANKKTRGAKDTSITTTTITVAGTIIVASIGVISVWLQQQSVKTPNETSTPIVSTPEVTPTNMQSNVYFDDFSSGTSKWWPVENLDNDYATEIRSVKNNLYNWEVVTKQGVIAAIYSDTLPATSDFELTLQLKEVKSSDTDISYGVMFRYSDNGRYRFAINGKGESAFSRKLKGEESYQYLVPWGETSAIHLQEYNELKVIARSSKIQLFINDALIGDIVDEALKSGEIVLFASMSENQSLVIEMKSFNLTLLP